MYDGALVRLRAIEAGSDVDAFHRWFNDVEVTRYLLARYPRSREWLRTRLTEWESVTFEAARFVIDRRDTGESIGFAALRDIAPEVRDAEVDLIVGEKSAWGHGYGTDAIRTLCRFGFDELGLHRVHLHVFPDNVAAVKAYERAGFVVEGRLRETAFKRGAFHDVLLMAVLAGELR